ncbi:hypothetical protein L486_04764 [Kwoniella mangroviensis CBS 10435]|uniref:RING-type domain-containing protein n=1 Tax=Kwoniella mangroviensis CBS 10435 TaxID=1331196 RepID=A0A1B9IP04_9TREE|nr:uncharacterized protein I203_00495 [Kwoniella mangroviensis CBS 8507]OCF57308.1 hypothetical protein L486_04764 [Kwoniella mangroviensis CBS 10435]OCF70361.1 hypothetical protein I203_00495 [Kwoniella mangroviensis CBS 8507]
MYSPRLSLSSLLVIPTISTFILQSLPTSAYIPAIAVNDTSGLNFTDSSTIAISWTDPVGMYSGAVSFQLQADVRTGGTTSGALVHFAESSMGENLTTSTPWIAYISCDVNETTASDEWDIFTLARDRGAVSALLYTAHSQSCLLNSEYITDFEKPLDVFATKTVQVARLIDNQFVHTNTSFENYNGTLLNISGTDVNSSLANNAPSYKSFLMGTLTARNSTGQATATGIPNATPTNDGSSSGGGSGNKKTSAPMIVLYTITGVVSFMFIFMLMIMGARRAMLHPERYGRRENDDEHGPPQSTARGLAQAVLDTFPVIKYNRNNEEGYHRGEVEGEEQGTPPKSLNSENAISLNQMSRNDRTNSYGYGYGYHQNDAESSKSGGVQVSEVERRMSSIASGSGSKMPKQYDELDQDAAMGVGTEGQGQQCPICLVDFEPGDDLRVLPCEREHAYHQSCIDPWLLQVSSSCPLCRKDFNAPPATSILSNSQSSSDSSPSPHSSTYPSLDQPSPQTQPPTQHGFARYLAFMRRERTNRNRRRSRTDSGVGQGRSREADQTGPGGY